MSRPVRITLITLVVVGGACAFWWLASSSVEPVVQAVPEGTAQVPQPIVATSAPAAPTPAPRSSASFAPVPEGLDMRVKFPDLRDARTLRRRHQHAIDLGLTVEATAEGTDSISDGYGWPTDRDGIESAIAELRGEMHDCVDGYGSDVGAFAGRVVVGFDVSAAAIEAGVAYPQELRVTGANVPQAIQSCMTSVYSNMPFEPPTDGVVRVDYPIELSFE